jgi:hypothetical protein
MVKFLTELAPTFSMLAWDDYDVRRRHVAFLSQAFPKKKSRLDAFFPKYYLRQTVLEEVGDLITSLSRADRWDFERIKPYRKRSFARFKADRNENRWEIIRIPISEFSQSAPCLNGNFRVLPRLFNETSLLVTDHSEVKKLINCVAEIVRGVRPQTKKMEMSLHQTAIFADQESFGDNSPEGIHQDGADYIVSALVVERDGVIGGESVLYQPDKKTEILRTTLSSGYGLFQIDKGSDLWHYVTPIFKDPAIHQTYGKRTLFGFDIHITD